MKALLHVLLVGNDGLFVGILEERLTGDEFQCRVTRVGNRESFLSALEQDSWDLIVADHGLPEFDGLTALDLARVKCPEIPFIILSGVAGEELAIESLKRGATDYVLKDKPARLEPAVRRAVRERNEREDRLRAELALKESEERLSLALEAVQLGTFDYISDSGRLICSPVACQILGMKEVIGHGARLLTKGIHPDDHQRVVNRLEEAFSPDGPAEVELEYRIRSKEGVDKWIRLHGRVTALPDPNHSIRHYLRVLGTIQDITPAKQAQESQRISEERLACIIESAIEAIVTLDESHHITLLNPAAERMFGLSQKEAIGLPIERFLPQIPLTPANTDAPPAGSPATFRGFSEIRGQKMDGSAFPAEASFSLTETRGGRLITVILRDISERHAAERERERLENQLRQAQKLEAIGTLAGGIAHDFNNILGAILGYTELAKLDSADNAPVCESLNAVLKASHRAKDLVKQILAFSRQGQSAQSPIELSSIVKETVKLLQAAIPKPIEISSSIASKLPLVNADPTQIQQVIMNLATNSAQAMSGTGGLLSIDLDRRELDEAEAKKHSGLAAGTHLILRISDTGTGMDAATMERMFEPFFTTKPPGEGTGLGLSVVMGIVQSHRGEITAESVPGKGTSFTILLPAEEAPPEPALPKSNDELKGHGEHVLVIDDEEALANMARRMLERMGYRVTTTTDPEKAIGLFRSAPDTYDVVVTDYAMPGLDGLKLARSMMDTSPKIPVILATGLGSHVNKNAVAESGIRIMLAKPYTFNALGEAVEDAIQQHTRHGT